MISLMLWPLICSIKLIKQFGTSKWAKTEFHNIKREFSDSQLQSSYWFININLDFETSSIINGKKKKILVSGVRNSSFVLIVRKLSNGGSLLWNEFLTISFAPIVTHSFVFSSHFHPPAEFIRNAVSLTNSITFPM